MRITQTIATRATLVLLTLAVGIAVSLDNPSSAIFDRTFYLGGMVFFFWLSLNPHIALSLERNIDQAIANTRLRHLLGVAWALMLASFLF